MLEKKVLNTKHCVYNSLGGGSEPINYFTCLIDMGIRNLITLVPRAFFVDRCENLILVLLCICKADLECKEIRASDWLKPPISTLLALVFFILHSRFGFAYKEPIYIVQTWVA